MLRWKMSVCPAAVLLLSVCQSANAETADTSALAYQPLDKQYSSPDCQDEHCSTVKISALTFPNNSSLTEQVQERLLALALGITDGDDTPADDWDHFADEFFHRAEEDNTRLPHPMASEAQLSASVFSRQNDLLVLELDSYVIYAGQAHGLPSTQFMVIDERLNEVVTLDDMLMAGGQEGFDEALAEAHERWMSEQDVGEDFASSWPFTDSTNVAPLEKEWMVKYNVYEIAPYVMGQPELTIPVEELKGIVEPRYLGQ